MNPLIVGMRYGMNLFSMAAQQRGYLTALSVGSRFMLNEVSKLPKAIYLARRPELAGQRPVAFSDSILAALESYGVDLIPYHIDAGAFHTHIAENAYPKNYAAGPVQQGGVREKKLLEYFVSLDLLHLKSSDTVIDIASEWSIFPIMVRKLTGACVYRQDLIYPPGIQGDRIGGNAANMPLPDEFADKLVLHNAFEHFEGTADTGFIREAWRILKPGGLLCILPVFMAEHHSNLSDPLVDRRNITWDPEARVIELPWCHHRFGRFYDAGSLHRRVLEPARRTGFNVAFYHVLNVRAVVPESLLHFALVLEKPIA